MKSEEFGEIVMEFMGAGDGGNTFLGGKMGFKRLGGKWGRGRLIEGKKIKKKKPFFYFFIYF